MRLRLFASYREAAGWGEKELPYDVGLTAGALWSAVAGGARGLPDLPALVAVNGAMVARLDEPVADGDEVAFLPPVSGG
ncbi:MAG: MoaD/ThiS family protein [Anaerolineae bacterium]